VKPVAAETGGLKPDGTRAASAGANTA